ncbi:translation initiation factor IF-2 [Kamptonema cortianum]|nr:translation initiation factor IF-2 [Geitlerinema splendidum]MDK3158686.1 translation initiation factor IF-2 [Kamptonema cortianum]
MPAEVKQPEMSIKIAEFAKKHGVAADQVAANLADLGIEVSQDQFIIDDDGLELLLEALGVEAAPAGDVAHLQPGKTTPRDVAAAVGKSDKEVLTTLIKKFKKMVTLTTAIDDELAEGLAKEFGFTVNWAKPSQAKEQVAKPTTGKSQGAVTRPPVVTILGHVDHGKTSLLDYIRKANVVAKEHGGITQHIGAYQVELPSGTITFLDTPGHAAFTAMRARGAQVTDIAVLVVAADDGLMPQTIEAISHAKNAEVPIIVAVNKIDKPAANVDKVLMALPNHDLIPESFGGSVITCPVSAMTGEGVPQLLEMILLQAEMMELKADPKGEFSGVVVEAQLEKGRGPVATILVEEGTLRIGDVIVVGNTWGKIKAMSNWAGERVKEAGPSQPVEILGLNEVPGAGDKVEWAEDEKAARDLAESRADEARRVAMYTPKKRVSLKDIRKHLDADETKDLNLIIKADVQGSVEAVKGMLEKIKNDEVNVRILLASVGSITESDILLASTSDAIVVGFNSKPETKAKSEAERQKVEIRCYNIIYELIEDIEAAVKGMLEPKFEEEYHGTVEIRAVFKLTKAGKVAGCHVTDGKILRNDKVRVRRDNEIVFEGGLDSLRNVKQDVREIIAGQDCGIRFAGWDEFAEGDVIEAYDLVQVM